MINHRDLLADMDAATETPAQGRGTFVSGRKQATIVPTALYLR